MQANEYQKKTQDTAIYPGAGTGDNRELTYLGLGLTSEAGKVSGIIKKLIRDGLYEPTKLAYELGDVAWYLARLAEAIGFDLEDIFQLNYAKLKLRKEKGTLQGSGDNR